MEFLAYRKGDLDISAIRNDTLNASFQMLDSSEQAIDLSSYTSAKCQLRENEYSTSAAATFYSSGGTYSIDISQLATGIITLNAVSLAVDAKEYLFDVQLMKTNTIETIAGGKFIVIPDITL